MALLNYTTKIPHEQSVMEIQKMLAKAGATAIVQEYAPDASIKAVAFQLKISSTGELAGFRLPTDWRPIQVIQQRRRGKDSNYRPWMGEQAHAMNIAWRIVKDWIEAQLALIETGMVEPEQVFLPYLLMGAGANAQTVYERFKDRPQFLLGSGE